MPGFRPSFRAACIGMAVRTDALSRTAANQFTFNGMRHNSQAESFNGAAIRHREKAVRGLLPATAIPK